MLLRFISFIFMTLIGICASLDAFGDRSPSSMVCHKVFEDHGRTERLSAGAVDAQFDEIAMLDDWKSDFQTQRTLRDEDRAALDLYLERAIEVLGEGRSARHYLDEMKSIRTQVSRRNSNFDLSHTPSERLAESHVEFQAQDILARLKPEELVPELNSPTVHAVTLTAEVIRFLHELPPSRAVKFMKAIHKGFTPAHTGGGIVRLEQSGENLIEVKIVGDGGDLRLIGCINKGSLSLRTTFIKRGVAPAMAMGRFRVLCR